MNEFLFDLARDLADGRVSYDGSGGAVPANLVVVIGGALRLDDLNALAVARLVLRAMSIQLAVADLNDGGTTGSGVDYHDYLLPD